MNYGKAVEEVWQWREAAARDALAVPKDKRVQYLSDSNRDAVKHLGLKGRIASLRSKKSAA